MRLAEILSGKNSNFSVYAPVTAAFLGDSVTHGSFEIFKGKRYEIDTNYDHEAVYHAVLKRMMNNIFPNAPLNVINAGISGGSAPQGLDRLERDILPYSPDLVVVCFGLNDAFKGLDKIDEYSDALRGIFRKLKGKETEVLFMTPNMMNTYVSPLITEDNFRNIAEVTAELQNGGTMDAYMDRAIKICKEEGVPVCNCYSKWKQLFNAGVDTTALLSNYINHPTREMHKLFANALFDTILFSSNP